MWKVFGIAIVGLAALAILFLLWRLYLQRKAEAAALAEPFPERWREILQAHVPTYRLLPDREREVLEGQVQRFLAQKVFEPCGELDGVGDEMRLTAAGNACLLLVGNPEERPFPSLRSILLYPDTFVRPGEEDGEEESLLLGESWDTGSVVLSWSAMLEDVDAGADGFNVVLHEFAHQLDQDFGLADGLPELHEGEHYRTWAKAFSLGYENHRKNTAKGRRTVVDPYGAEHPAEFFSCVTEVFFERPKKLSEELPEVFDELRRYYRIDPRTWMA